MVSFSPTTPLSFFPQLLGTTSYSQDVTLTNTGTTALSISSISVHKPFLLGGKTTCGASVAAGANCTLSVLFQPTVMGLKTGLLVLSDSASTQPQVIELSGTGTTLTVSPTQLNFGSQKVNTKSPPQHATVTNTGNTAVSVAGVSITGTDSYDYSQTNTCGSQIDPGATCGISVILHGFHPRPGRSICRIEALPIVPHHETQPSFPRCVQLHPDMAGAAVLDRIA
jgi:hypothetical protein